LIKREDRSLFERYLSLAPRRLSAYHFINIFIWRALFDVSWCVIDDCLCVFFSDTQGCFMYLPPLGARGPEHAMRSCFTLMNACNRDQRISRIENVDAEDMKLFKNAGYNCMEKAPDIICSQKDLAQLRGELFKSKRSACNYFTRHYDYQYRPFLFDDTDECLSLNRSWREERGGKKNDAFYRYMLEDSGKVQEEMLRHYTALEPIGRVVIVGKRIVGYTFGYALNPDMFCVLFEVCSLSYKGLAQFIFREFCRELDSYSSVNIMDDSGLDNLKSVKNSYRPINQVPNFIITQT
jgi:hypothetical protein